MGQNVWDRAPRNSAATRALIGDLDEWLNQSTGGAFQSVLDNYTTRSRAIDQAKAAARVRGKWWELSEDTNLPVRVRGRSLDIPTDASTREIPHFTEDAVGKAMDLAMNKEKVSQLSPEARQGLTQTMDVLSRQDLAGKVARSGTLGGSDTAMNWMSMADQGLTNALTGAIPGLAAIAPVTGPAMRARRESLGGLQRTLVDAALADPTRMRQLMQSPMVRPEVKDEIVAAALAAGRIGGGEQVLQQSRKDQQP